MSGENLNIPTISWFNTFAVFLLMAFYLLFSGSYGNIPFFMYACMCPLFDWSLLQSHYYFISKYVLIFTVSVNRSIFHSLFPLVLFSFSHVSRSRKLKTTVSHLLMFPATFQNN